MMRNKAVCLTVLSVVLAGYSCAKQQPKFGVLPAFDAPLCVPATKKTVGKTECLRRLTAFVGRGLSAVVSLRSAPDPKIRTKQVETFLGVGVIADGQGHVLTSYRAIEGRTQVIGVIARKVGGKNGKLVYTEERVVLSVRAHADRLGIAVLEPASPTVMPRPLPIEAVPRWHEKDERVWLLGASAFTYVGRIGERPLEEGADTDRVAITMDADAANLGGPVVTKWGDVIGILVAPSLDDQPAKFVPISTAVQVFGLSDTPAAKE